MRLSKLIAELPDDRLKKLAQVVVSGAEQRSPSLWPSDLEAALARSGWVEDAIFARRPPVASVLLGLLEAPNQFLSEEELRVQAEKEAEDWCTRVSDGDLARRVSETARLYLRMLETAWANDLRLDPSEARMLSLLRDELGMLRMEHFLSAHHRTIRPYWETEDPFGDVVDTLVENGILFRTDGGLALPDELVSHVLSGLGVELPRPAARRLYECLDSGTHLRRALEDYDIPSSSMRKQERIDALVDHFIPPSSVLNQLHIADVRAHAGKLGITKSGQKEQVVARIVTHYRLGRDLDCPVEEAATRPPEARRLEHEAFATLFLRLRGHELQRILMALDLRHSGSKDVRVAELWNSHLSEHTLLGKLRAKALERLLSGFGLPRAGTKAEKIEGLLEGVAHFRGDEQLGEEDRFLRAISDEVGRVELSSRSSTRFDRLRAQLAAELPVASGQIGVKYLADPKNYRNRIGEALRQQPELLVLLGGDANWEEISSALQSRISLSPKTATLVLVTEDDGSWTCPAVVSAVPSATQAALSAVFVSAEDIRASVEAGVNGSDRAELRQRLQSNLNAVGSSGLSHTEDTCFDAIVETFDSPRVRIRTKHVSDQKNLGNRISEALGAGCSGLVLVTSPELAVAAASEVQRQLSTLNDLVLAVVLQEEEDGGYGVPQVIDA